MIWPAATVLAYRLSGVALGYALTLLISKQYGAAALGLFTLGFVILKIAAMTGRFGLDTLMLRTVSVGMEIGNLQEITIEYHKIVSLAIRISLIVSVLVGGLAYPIAHLVGKPDLAKHLLVFCIAVLPLSLTFIYSEALRGLGYPRDYAWLQYVGALIIAVPCLAAASYISHDAIAATIAYTGGVIAVYVLGQVRLRRRFQVAGIEVSPIGVRLNYLGKKDIVELLTSAAPLFMASVTYLIMGWTDVLMLGALSTAHSVGVYNVALKLATTATFPLLAVNGVVAKRIAGAWSAGDSVGLSENFRWGLRIALVGALLVASVLFIFGEYVLGVFGDEFRLGYGSMLTLLSAYLFGAACGPVAITLQMAGGERVFQRILLFTTIVNVGMNWILIPRYDILGAAVATSMSFVLWNAASIAYIAKRYNIFSWRNGRHR